MTRLAAVHYMWGPRDRPRVCRLCGEAQPRILTARLMVSLPVHVSCFDLNIVYTYMSVVTRVLSGPIGGKPDALTRRSGDLPKGMNFFQSENRFC